MDAIGWKYLLVYCCWILVEAILIWFLWPETSGRSLEELAFRAYSLTRSLLRTWLICFSLVFGAGEYALRTEKAVENAVLHIDEAVENSAKPAEPKDRV